ncbi:zinc finger MYM-type protein 5 [Artemisia annua]|uniref:Zinc finger MYM-type protein 5 n=1 Tax=Artemisia annua TaxID=35608 RepID=A0A2U1LII0_ARTAN|nr:zinc finger MYM-type protein 5 [Artemisia annua]
MRLISEDNERPIEENNGSPQYCYVDGVNHNIFDVRVWDGLDSNINALLVSKGVVRETNINHPKERFGRHFSCEHYVHKLQNGESYDRKWMIYSKELDKVFCLCCITKNDFEIMAIIVRSLSRSKNEEGFQDQQSHILMSNLPTVNNGQPETMTVTEGFTSMQFFPNNARLRVESTRFDAAIHSAKLNRKASVIVSGGGGNVMIERALFRAFWKFTLIVGSTAIRRNLS